MPEVTLEQALQVALGHHQAGRLQEAETIYRQILAVQPDHPDALHLLGMIARQVGQLDAAADLIRQAIALVPDNAVFHCNLGLVLQDQFDQAIPCYRRAIALQPDLPEAHYNLGNAFAGKGQLDQAIASYRKALELNPDYVEVYNNLAGALMANGQLDQAITCYQRALTLKANSPESHCNLGNAFRNKGQLEQAIASCRRALALKPDLPEAHCNLANALKDMGNLDAAINGYRQAIDIDPEFIIAHDGLLLTLHYHLASTRQSLFAEAQRWNQQHARSLKQFIQPHSNNRDPERRLRVGYVSPDLCRHAVGHFLLPLLAAHDRQAFQVFCYAQVPAPDETTAALQAQADVWRSIVGLSDQQAAEMIRQDQIDILIDLAMHTANNRLPIFARKPAPVQVTYLAYAGGTGLDTIDYRLTDCHLDPDEANDQFYMEKSLRLAGTYWCYQQSTNTPPANQLPALSAGHIAFGCLNNFCKVSESVLETWACLLRALPGARLFLHMRPGEQRDRVKHFMEDRGVAPDRLELVDRLSPEEYFQVYQRIDIALDPFPYCGGTTTCDALWMGVPVVTLAGQTAVGRAGVSILSNAGLPELIAQTPQQYIQIATDLANNLPRLSQLRSTLRQRMQASPLMDARSYARGIEAAYRAMWQHWCLA